MKCPFYEEARIRYCKALEKKIMILEYIFSIVINGILPCFPGRRKSFLSNSCIEEAFWSNNSKKGIENQNMGVYQCSLIILKLNP